jgi:predicted nucleotidyltransferase
VNEFNQHQKMIAKVAQALGEELLQQMAFVGGCTTGFFITDDFVQEQIRFTDDVDIIVHLVTRYDWVKLQEQLRRRGFKEKIEESPICSMYLDSLRVDFMPDNESILGFSNCWYAEALQNVQWYSLNDSLKIPLISSVYFVATKLEAYIGRGHNDPLGSRDVEDIVNIFDGREEICKEINQASPELRQYIAKKLGELLKNPSFEYVVQSAAQNNRERENLIFERLELVIKNGEKI